MHVYGAFNVEPALYLEGYCGMRHCGMVVVTQDGAEVLTAFQTAPADLRLDARRLNSGS